MSGKPSPGPRPTPRYAASFLLWPLIVAASASEAMAAQAADFARLVAGPEVAPAPGTVAAWATPHRVRLDMPSMALRDFSTDDAGDCFGTPALVCAPFALRGASLADFAPGHSLVAALLGNGCPRLFVTDWHSATREMRLLTIDNYLADLNVAVDEAGTPVDLVGLCQGGWMALLYAARFPAKVRKLVLAGAPIDLGVGASLMSLAARHLPLGLFDEIVRLGEGRVLGQRVLDLWDPALQGREGAAVLQLPSADGPEAAAILERFRAWYDTTVDLPGAYYHQVVSWLFKENRLARGRFMALGREVDLHDVRHPLFLLAARDDELVSADQLMAAAQLVGTPAAEIATAVEPCGHLGLFMGARTVKGAWVDVARWLAQASST